LSQAEAEIWDTKRPWLKGALVRQGSVEGEQTGSREMARSTRWLTGVQDLVELEPGMHRSVAGDELITRKPWMRSERMGEVSSGRN
jgi:hypothetical protein